MFYGMHSVNTEPARWRLPGGGTSHAPSGRRCSPPGIGICACARARGEERRGKNNESNVIAVVELVVGKSKTYSIKTQYQNIEQ
jgi:hypothetical protein